MRNFFVDETKKKQEQIPFEDMSEIEINCNIFLENSVSAPRVVTRNIKKII